MSKSDSPKGSMDALKIVLKVLSVIPFTVIALVIAITAYNTDSASTAKTSLIFIPFALSIEAWKAASNKDTAVIVDQFTSLGCAIILMLFFFGVFGKSYSNIWDYFPFQVASIATACDVINGFIIGRMNRSR